jgi:hypothetical protein
MLTFRSIFLNSRRFLSISRLVRPCLPAPLHACGVLTYCYSQIYNAPSSLRRKTLLCATGVRNARAGPTIPFIFYACAHSSRNPTTCRRSLFRRQTRRRRERWKGNTSIFIRRVGTPRKGTHLRTCLMFSMLQEGCETSACSGLFKFKFVYAN